MRCIACDKLIEDVNLDDKLELCNKCFSQSMQNLDTLLNPDNDKEV